LKRVGEVLKCDAAVIHFKYSMRSSISRTMAKSIPEADIQCRLWTTFWRAKFPFLCRFL